MTRWLKTHKKWWFGAFLLVALIWLAFGWGNGDGLAELYRVVPSTVSQSVSLVGTVVPVGEAELGFDISGRVSAVPASAGARVRRGEGLGQLALGTLPAELAAGEADLALKQAEGGSATMTLAKVKQEQDALVSSAYHTLLSDGLAAVPRLDSYNVTPPTITGRYSGSEGIYKIRFKTGSESVIDNLDLIIFGLETIPARPVLESEPTPLGTRGLFLTLAADFASYRETTWQITIPNPKAADYLANLNAYQEAQQTRARAVAEAEADLTRPAGGVTASEAEQARARAEIARIKAEIALRTLRAPIDGVVVAQEARVGEAVTANAVLARVISADQFEIEVRIPETDVGKLAVGQTGVLTLDAYGAGREYPVRLSRIDAGETVREGVPTYKGVLNLTAAHPPATLRSPPPQNPTYPQKTARGAGEGLKQGF